MKSPIGPCHRFPIFTLGRAVSRRSGPTTPGAVSGLGSEGSVGPDHLALYSAYLHCACRGFGLRSSWMAVGGFVILMFNLIAINLGVCRSSSCA